MPRMIESSPDAFSEAVAKLLFASEIKENMTRGARDDGATASSNSTASSGSESSRSPSPTAMGGDDGDGRRPHSCHFANCTRSFGRLEHLKRHIRSHTGERPFGCTFEGCTKHFSRYDNMLQHARCHTEKYVRRRKRGSAASPTASSSAGSSPRSTMDVQKLRRGLSSLSGSSTPTMSGSSSPLTPPATQFDNEFSSGDRAGRDTLSKGTSLPLLRHQDVKPPAAAPAASSAKYAGPVLPPLLPTNGNSASGTAPANGNVDAYFLERIRAANTLASFQFGSSPNSQELMSGRPAVLSA